jgi:hypothetical protein
VKEQLRYEKGADGHLHEQKRREYLKRSTCAEHGRTLTEFIGVNDKGWIFRCAGPKRAEGAMEAYHLVLNADPDAKKKNAKR